MFRDPRLVSGNRARVAIAHMLGQLACAAPDGPVPCAGAVVDELPLSVVVELLPESVEVELELSLVCACATIAPPPTIAPASPTDSKPLRIHFCICITSFRRVVFRAHNTARPERHLKSGKSSARMRDSWLMLSARTGRGREPSRMFSSGRRLNRAFVLATLLVTFVVPFATTDVALASPSSNRRVIGAGLRGPSGLSATVYAKGLKHVSALASDAQGRMWVATAAASDRGKDAIYLVTESGATPTTVVTDVHTPLGIVWVGDKLYMAQADSVVALSGFDGTAFTSRTTIVSFLDGTGEVNGITFGSDGRFYVGVSAPCNACTPTDTYSASVVSFLPDGSDLLVFASGIRAPIGLAFFPGTNDLFVTMNQRDDLGAKTPGDWLAVVRHGESWGSPSYYGQRGAKYADLPTPVAALDQHAAVSGVAIVTGQLGSSVGTAAVVAEWVTGKVKLVRLTATDEGYTGTTVSFLSGFENPVPVLLDGSTLFVGDWTSGTLYRITT